MSKSRNNPFTRLLRNFFGIKKLAIDYFFKGVWSLIDIVKDEKKAIELREALRFHNGVFCPRCGIMDYETTAPHRYKCKSCEKPFNVDTGTPFERAHIPFGKWIMAIDYDCNTTGGINSNDLASQIEVNKNTALKMQDVIRLMGYDQTLWDLSEKKKGYRKNYSEIQEWDFCFCGGSRTNFTRKQKIDRPNYRKDKIKVLGCVVRNGYAKAVVVDGWSAKKIIEFMRKHIKKGTRVCTDSEMMFKVLRSYGIKHKFVNHSKGEYVRGWVYTQTIESLWALLKTGLMSAFRNRLTKKNAVKFINAFIFRFNSNEFTRMEKLVIVLLNIYYVCDINQRELNGE